MDSAVEDILAFKTCCGLKAFDQNLEIHVTNSGDRPIRVPSRLELRGPGGAQRVDNLMPHGVHAVAPGATMAFYCTMDPAQWRAAREVVFFDDQGNQHRQALDHHPN